jgi:ketosteroid isomerase-like protein
MQTNIGLQSTTSAERSTGLAAQRLSVCLHAVIISNCYAQDRAVTGAGLLGNILISNTSNRTLDCVPERERTAMSKLSTTEPAGAASPLAVLKAILANPTDLAHVKQYTTDDFTYVSLNYENLPLKKIMPWAGTTAGTQALVQTFIDVGRYWRTDDFTIEDSFENVDGAALFGRFTYTSTVLGKTVTSPFAVLARGKNGKLSYIQFMEDTFGTVRSFLDSGSYRIKSNPDGSTVDV